MALTLLFENIRNFRSSSKQSAISEKIKVETRNHFFPGFRKVLYLIFCVFGLDFSCDYSSKLKNNIINFNKIANVILYLFSFTNYCRDRKVVPFLSSDAGMKIFYAEGIEYICSAVIFCTLHFSIRKAAKIFMHVIRLKKKLHTQHSGTFSSFCIIFIVINYLSNIIILFHPFTKGRYETLLSSWHFKESNNENLKICIACLLVAFRCFFITFLPDSVIALYIITCHDIQTILSFHLRKYKKNKILSVRRLLTFLDSYQEILVNFHAFESSFCFLICLAFTTKITSLLTNVLLLNKFPDNTVFIYRAFMSFSCITIIFYIASKVAETDKHAKEINLQMLERMLFITAEFPFSNAFSIWRLNTSPPFTLTVWNFFSFTRHTYLNCIGALVTYTLLLVNL